MKRMSAHYYSLVRTRLNTNNTSQVRQPLASKCNLHPRLKDSAGDTDDVHPESAQNLPPAQITSSEWSSLQPNSPEQDGRSRTLPELKAGVRRDSTNVRSLQAHVFINPSTTRSFLCLQGLIKLQKQTIICIEPGNILTRWEAPANGIPRLILSISVC